MSKRKKQRRVERQNSQQRNVVTIPPRAPMGPATSPRSSVSALRTPATTWRGTMEWLASGWRGLALVALVVGAAMALASSAVSQKSMTIDEFVAVPFGSAMLKTRDFHLATNNPPLSYALEAAPMWFTQARIGTEGFAGQPSVWRVAQQFMDANRERFHQYTQLARSVSLGILALTLLLVYGLARSLYGPAGGLLAATFASLCPNLLAHGALATPDIYLTAGIIGSLWAFDWLLRRPGWAPASVLGIAMGAACLSKFTGLLLLGVLPAVAYGLQAWPPPRRRSGDDTPMVVGRDAWRWGLAAVAVAVLVINIGYLFDGSLTVLGSYPFRTRPFQSLQRMLPGWLPVPLPYYFFLGWDVQLGEGGYVAYLLGQFSDQGFPHYYLVGLLVKTPCPVLAAVALAWVWGGRPSRREVPVLATAAALLAFLSFGGHKNIGVRYVLFLFPLMSLWIGRLTRVDLRRGDYPRKLALGVAAALAWLVVIALAVWPDYIAYFNLVSGGPSNGHRYLLDSNLDWGQDLIALREYMNREKIGSVDLAYAGRVKPEIYGIRYSDLVGRPEQRYVAVSANLLWGRMYFVNGSSRWPRNKDTYAYLRPLAPKAVLGHTIYVYDLEGEPGTVMPGTPGRP
jgi:hypothetical protein